MVATGCRHRAVSFRQVIPVDGAIWAEPVIPAAHISSCRGHSTLTLVADVLFGLEADSQVITAVTAALRFTRDGLSLQPGR